ncbi:GGDEF domain-containing protein [Bdellovibrionota bacterium FG-2]
MDRKHLETSLFEIRQLLSNLHGEVTELEASYSRVLSVIQNLEGVCNVDELTGLLRRKAFFAKWKTILDTCEKETENCGMIIVDIDHFKKINDTLGHVEGDVVLKRVAGLLKNFESAGCVVGRFGGEEFVIAAEGSQQDLLTLAERVRRQVERFGGCSISVGVASTERLGYESEKLLTEADKALYVAKASGRNQVKAA